ncbi:MAG: hypothetical protein ACI8W3_000179 [Myxococcota bacterium]
MIKRTLFRSIRIVAALALLVAAALWATGCVSQPRDTGDLCSVFGQRHAWYRATKASQERWGVDQATQMSVMFQESSLRARARPPRTKVFGFIPWTRRSSAYGYAQVIDSTWGVYLKNAGNPDARRDRFADAADFVGWYMHRISKRAKIEKHEARDLYLAYHEGAGGFSRGSHLRKTWLLDASNRVGKRAVRYRRQLAGCRERLDSYRWWWPF